MNVDEIRKSLGQSNPPAGLTHALASDCGWMPKAIGREPSSSAAARSFRQALHLHG